MYVISLYYIHIKSINIIDNGKIGLCILSRMTTPKKINTPLRRAP